MLAFNAQGGDGNSFPETRSTRGSAGQSVGPSGTQQYARPAVVPRPGAGLPARPIPPYGNSGPNQPQHPYTRQYSQANAGGRSSAAPRAESGLPASAVPQQGMPSSRQHHYQMRSSTNSGMMHYNQGDFFIVLYFDWYR